MNLAREIRRYIRVFWTWGWLILIGAILAGAANYYFSSNAKPQYEASAPLMIGQIIRQPNPDQQEIGLADRLVLYYLELLRRQPVLDGVKQELQLTIPNDILASMLSARVVPSTAFIELVVTDTDSNRVVRLVNAFSKELIKQSPTAPENTNKAQRDFVQNQLDELQSKIEGGRKSLADLNQTLNTSTTAVEIAEANAKIKALQTQIDTWQANYIDLLRTSNLSSPNSISILETSNQATRIQTISPLISAAIAAAIGAILAMVFSFFLEYLDDRIKSGADIEARLKLVVLGHVPTKKTRKPKTGGNQTLNEKFNLNREAVEAYEIISTGILFSEILAKHRKSILITAPTRIEQQPNVVLDLAISMVSFSQTVLLVDADTDQPRLHELLGLANRPGFYEIFYGGSFSQLEDKVLETAIPHLYLIPAGLSEGHNRQITIWNHGTQRIYNLPQNPLPGDFAIFNCDSVLHDKTTRLLSSNITGTILLCELKRTRGQELKAAVEVVERLHGEVLGIVTLDPGKRKPKTPARATQARSNPEKAAESKDKVKATDKVANPAPSEKPAAADQPGPDVEPVITPPPVAARVHTGQPVSRVSVVKNVPEPQIISRYEGPNKASIRQKEPYKSEEMQITKPWPVNGNGLSGTSRDKPLKLYPLNDYDVDGFEVPDYEVDGFEVHNFDIDEFEVPEDSPIVRPARES
jgi:capsular polysaccharide biosynthesis protein/MinD-like ATPase involved in chromosome partitioning or flagellar assembly